ncbi:Exosome component 3 [Lunasporangiospora selenospora]|uniref:Ribosomal RNA-processing protein 40 n=1 Tax=Lunasporangiospora selenospora TaxID=979761 RepID=A0A9P6FMJ9_9FUNG|nr:Exosome component 3 [Lunasporangiospora selenospora]
MAPPVQNTPAEQQDGEQYESGLHVILPGDLLPPTQSQDSEDVVMAPVIKLGPGLQPMSDESIVAVKAGILQSTASANRWWVQSNQKRYVPSSGESVIGIVRGKTAEHYKLDIGAAHPALLGVMAFEGATKRNRPNHEASILGDLLYCRVALANKDMDPELECFNPTTGKADGYGGLEGGHVFKVSLGLARRLLDPKTLVLRLLGQHIPFETAVGINGRVWINSASASHTILVCNAIKNSEYLSPKECESMVKSLIQKM